MASVLDAYYVAINNAEVLLKDAEKEEYRPEWVIARALQAMAEMKLAEMRAHVS